MRFFRERQKTPRSIAAPVTLRQVAPQPAAAPRSEPMDPAPPPVAALGEDLSHQPAEAQRTADIARRVQTRAEIEDYVADLLADEDVDDSFTRQSYDEKDTEEMEGGRILSALRSTRNTSREADAPLHPAATPDREEGRGPARPFGRVASRSVERDADRADADRPLAAQADDLPPRDPVRPRTGPNRVIVRSSVQPPAARPDQDSHATKQPLPHWPVMQGLLRQDLLPQDDRPQRPQQQPGAAQDSAAAVEYTQPTPREAAARSANRRIWEIEDQVEPSAGPVAAASRLGGSDIARGVQTAPMARSLPVPPAAEPMPEPPRDRGLLPTRAEAPLADPLRESRPLRAAGRVKTRLLGFQTEDVTARGPFDRADSPRETPTVAMFPVGWLVVIGGPGRGASFALFNGVSHLGRGEDQTVQLDFGDTSISRQNHAAIAFDDELGSFFLGHGGKSNLVRLNGKPVLSTEPLNDGDVIRLGQTTLRFVALCGERFSWVCDRGGAHGSVAAE